MPDEPSSNPSASEKPLTGPAVGPTINIGEEFGTARRNLPPAKIVGIAILSIAVVGGILAFLQRAKPQGQGSLDFVSTAEMPGQTAVMVAATVTLRNSSQKALWIHTIGAMLQTADGKEYTDPVAASAVDFERYFEALPSLREHATAALLPETKLMPGDEKTGTVIVSFPVDRAAFDGRKSFKVLVQPYDQVLPIELGQ